MLIRNMEKCNKCGLCALKCPQDNISLRGGRTFFDDGNCDNCSICVESCPNEAINIVLQVNSKGCIQCVSRCYKRVCSENALAPIPWIDINKCSLTRKKVREMALQGNVKAGIALEKANISLTEINKDSGSISCKICWNNCDAKELKGEPTISDDGKVLVAEKCIGCAFGCNTHCISNAIHIDVFIIRSKCVSCYKCVVICPQNRAGAKFDWQSLDDVTVKASQFNKNIKSLSPRYPKFARDDNVLIACSSVGACPNQKKIELDSVTK